MLHLKALLKSQWPGILWSIIILVLTGLPGNYFPQVTTFWDWLAPDKAVHLFIFGVLTFLLLLGHRKQYPLKKFRYRPVVFTITVSILYGGLTEFLQSNVFINRDGNVYDFLANTLGCLLGALVFYLAFRKKNQNVGKIFE